MTRINLVPVQSLSRLHLISEYRELPRIFALAHKASISNKPWTHKQPADYKLGTSHCIFFYDKLGFLADRHRLIVSEMLARGYKPALQDDLRGQWQERIPKAYWCGYEATEEALRISQERIDLRNKGK